MPFNNGPKIVTTGLSLLADASDQLSYPGSGTAWTDIITGTTASLSGSISYTTDFRGSLVTADSSSVIIFPPNTANFGTNTFTVEFAFRPSEINGQHWILSKNSGSFPNWGIYLTGSAGSGNLVAFFNISSAVSCSLASAPGSIVTGSNYIVDASLIPSTGISRLYINSETAATGSANGTGSLSATAPLFFSNLNSGSNSGTVNSIFNIKTYTPSLGRSLVRQNYNALGNRFGLSSKPFILANLLLDQYIGAAAAYSLRQLSSDYEGYAIRVRNSSNQELDIGFDSNGNLDTVTLLNHCGGGDGFVKTWYDQSGNGNDASQTTAANQPQIVSSGNVILENAKPAVQFDGSNDFLNGGNILNFSNYTTFQVFSSDIVSNVQQIQGKGYGGNYYNSWGSFIVSSKFRNNITISGPTEITSFSTLTLNNNSQYLGVGNFDNTNVLARINGANESLVAQTNNIINSTEPYVIGKLSRISTTTFPFKGKICELINYAFDNKSNISNIESNINDFYSIY